MRISLCIHCHQPVGNFDHVFRAALADAYLPFLQTLAGHPGVPVGLHISGCLAEWLQDNQPSVLELVGGLCASGSVELLASGYFEPVLPVWRRDDMLRQIDRFCGLMESIGGKRPTGLWVTERVWEPSLASLISEAGMEYAVVDEEHLLEGGVPPAETGKPWITEDSGRSLRLLPSSRRLRYMIPFSSVDRLRTELRDWHDSGRRLAFYGDDGEKFGVWPGTAELCYQRGWLEEFFTFIEETDWLEPVTPSAAAADPVASGPVYVPAASYPEMGEWTLSCEDQLRLANLRRSLDSSGLLESCTDFLRGGMWRNFLSRYPESNELHKRVLLAQEPVFGSGSEEALMHFWRSQCNCAYWHGVFGGIYLPHLREALWCELHMAEREAHRILCDLPVVDQRDIDADGRTEVLVMGGKMSLLVRPEEGMTVSELSYVPDTGRPVPLGHVLSRRPEAYHAWKGGAGGNGDTGSIHDPLPALPEELAGGIVYDPLRRMSFADVVMPAGTSMADWSVSGGKVVRFAHGSTRSWESRAGGGMLELTARLERGSFGFDRLLRISLTESLVTAVSSCAFCESGEFRSGFELALNLLSGEAPDRTIVLDDDPPVPAGSTGGSVSKVDRIVVRDSWRNVAVEIVPHQPSDVWFMPIESVSRSESGFEKVYQGTVLYVSAAARGAAGIVFGMDVRIGKAADVETG
jgi:alpha-amylase